MQVRNRIFWMFFYSCNKWTSDGSEMAFIRLTCAGLKLRREMGWSQETFPFFDIFFSVSALFEWIRFKCLACLLTCELSVRRWCWPFYHSPPLELRVCLSTEDGGSCVCLSMSVCLCLWLTHSPHFSHLYYYKRGCPKAWGIWWLILHLSASLVPRLRSPDLEPQQQQKNPQKTNKPLYGCLGFYSLWSVHPLSFMALPGFEKGQRGGVQTWKMAVRERTQRGEGEQSRWRLFCSHGSVSECTPMQLRQLVLPCLNPPLPPRHTHSSKLLN